MRLRHHAFFVFVFVFVFAFAFAFVFAFAFAAAGGASGFFAFFAAPLFLVVFSTAAPAAQRRKARNGSLSHSIIDGRREEGVFVCACVCARALTPCQQCCV